MSNFQEAYGAMEKMADSEGALAKANNVYLDSIKAHTQQLKNAFVDMSQAMLSSDTVKFFADLVKWIVQAVSAVVKFISTCGGLKTVLFAIITYLMMLKGEAIISALTNLIAKFTSLTGVVELLNGAIQALQAALKGLSSPAGVAAMAVAALMATVAAAKAVVRKMVEELDALIDAGDAAASNSQNLLDMYARYSDAGATSEEVAQAQRDLANALGITSSAFDLTAGSAESYAQMLRQALISQLELDLDSQLKGLEAQKKKIQMGLEHWDIIPKNQKAGNPFGIDTWDLDTLASRLSEFRNKLGEIRQEFGKDSKEYEQANEIYTEIVNKLGDYSESLVDFNQSVANLEFVKNASLIEKYTNAGADGFKKLREELIKTIAANDDFIGSEEMATTYVDKFLSTSEEFRDFYSNVESVSEAASHVANGFKEMADIADGTADAISKLDEVLKGDDYGTGMEKRVEYMQKLLEEVDAEHWGGKHYQALAEYFGVDTTASIDQQLEKIAAMRRYFDEADQGLINFLYDIHDLSSEYADFDENTGFFRFDADHVEELASALGLTKDAFADLVNLYRQYTPPAEWMQFPQDEVARWLEQDDIIKKIGDDLYIDKDRFEEYASSAGVNADELLSKIKDLDDYASLTEIELNINTESLEAAQSSLLIYAAQLRDLDYGASKIAQNIAASLSTLDEDLAVNLVMNLPPELMSLREEIISYLPEDLQAKIYADTEEADSAIDITTQKLEDLGAEIIEIDGSTITISVTDNGNIDSIMSKLNVLSAYASASGVNIRTNIAPKGAYSNAKGTRHASKGLSLLGDEYSASGRPKPELVISNGRAYLAGINGPVLGRLNAGDVVYSNKETRQILGSSYDQGAGIPAFASGTASRWWNKVSGGAGSLSSSSTYSSYYGTSSGSGSSASSSGSGDNWFEQQYELHNHYRKLDQETDEAYLTWLVAAWKQAYAEGIIELKDAHKYEEEAYELMKKIASSRFKDEYDTHQHMVAMGKETDQEYYSWLEWRHQTAYANNEITLEEYWKYQEEVYKKAKELVNDYFNDIDHKIDMLENAGKTDQEIIAWDEKGMLYAEERIAELIKEGKDNNDSAVQEQQKKWWSYYKDRQKREEDTTKKAKSAADELIDYRKKMLKKDLDNEKSSLNQRLTTLRDFYSKQKELLRDTYDEDKYLDEQAKKRKAVSDLEIQLAQIEYDNSAWAQKKRLELLQELADAQKDLADFEKEHALQVAQDKLDELQEMQEKELNDQIDAIEKVTESEEELYKKALQDVQNGGQDLYEAMVAYNNQYGTGNSEDIAEMWDEAYTALKKYKGLFDEYYKDIKLTYGNDTTPGVVDTSKIDAGLNPVQPVLESQKPAATVANAQATQPQAQTKATTQTAVKADPVVGTAVVLKSNGKLARSSYDSPSLTPISSVIGKTLYVQAAYPGRAAPYHIGTSTNFNDSSSWVGWVDKHQLVGYATGTRSALAGLHEINERGDEALFKTADGSTYRLFSGGERVFNSSATDFLYNFSNNPAAVLSAILSQIGGGRGEIKNNTLSQNISMGDIYIQGSATEKTISEIRREKRAEMDYMLKELNRLNRQ